MLITLLGLIVSALTLMALNEQGGMTNNRLRHAIALVLGLGAYALMAWEYGAFRGVFVLLGVWSLAGMLIAFIGVPRNAKR